ncbi:MAG: polysaccharide deacetylase family protein [Halanaerobacter sp.]
MKGIIKRSLSLLIVFLLIIIIIYGYNFYNNQDRVKMKNNNSNREEKYQAKSSKDEIIAKYRGQNSKEWGEDVSGVITKINTDKKVIALTLDACGGNDGYDSKLIDFLLTEEIPATLFINSRWIDEHKETFKKLADNPLFTIANHGSRHIPLSVTGKSIYGIKGTESVEEVVDEVITNQEKIEKLTGERPDYFRSGTAYYDEIAVKIVNDLGMQVIGYDILGDAGATFSTEEVEEALLGAKRGSIILAHMNRPQSETAEGIKAAVPKLKRKGFKFVKLEDYNQQ